MSSSVERTDTLLKRAWRWLATTAGLWFTGVVLPLTCFGIAWIGAGLLLRLIPPALVMIGAMALALVSIKRSAQSPPVRLTPARRILGGVLLTGVAFSAFAAMVTAPLGLLAVCMGGWGSWGPCSLGRGQPRTV